MKQFFQDLYKALFKEDLVMVKYKYFTPEKTKSDELYDLAASFLNIDVTPKDNINDEVACSEVMTTILAKFLGNFPIISYTPDLYAYLKKDIRFQEISYFKKGAIVLAPTGTGNGKISGHVGLCGKDGKIMSNSSATGLFVENFDEISWISRYSKLGQLDLHIFELVV